MSTHPIVTLTGRGLVVEWGGHGPAHVLTEDGQVTEQFHAPAYVLAEYVHPDDVAEWAIGLLVGVKLTKTAREAISDALNVDWPA